MNFRRAIEKLRSLIITATITSACLATVPDSFTTAAVASNLISDLPGRYGANDLAGADATQTSQTVTVEPSRLAPPLSATQLKKINEFHAAKGHNVAISEVVANKLGLPLKELKQLSVRDKKSGDIHVYSPLRDDGILISFLDATTAYTYRLDSHFKIVGSVAMTNHVPSDVTDPESGAKAELAFWAHVADQL